MAARKGVQAARRGLGMVAALVNLVAGVVATVIVIGILLVVLEANTGNTVVEAVLDAARFLVGPFKGIFSLDSRKLEVAVNWGLAAAVYVAAAALISKLLRR